MVHLGQESIFQAISITQKQFESLSPMPGGFPGGTGVKNPLAKAGIAEDAGSIPGSGSSPWSRKWQSTPVFLPGKLHGQRSLVGYRSWSQKESDTNEHTAHIHNTLGQIEVDRNLGII